MFLTGQRAQFPWDTQSNQRALFKKDHNYYKTRQNENLWENEYRSPKKLQKNIIEDRERYQQSAYSEQAIKAVKLAEDKQYDEKKISNLKLIDKSRLTLRRLERQVLQKKSKQQFTEETDISPVVQFLQEQPLLTEELILRRSNTFKDPEKKITRQAVRFFLMSCTESQMWENINKYPSSQINKIFRPKILEMERSGINRIVQKLQIQKEIKQFQKGWMLENRQNLRNALHLRHQAIKQLKNKAGIPLMIQDRYQQARSASVVDQRAVGLSSAQDNYLINSSKNSPKNQSTLRPQNLRKFNIDSPSPSPPGEQNIKRYLLTPPTQRLEAKTFYQTNKDGQNKIETNSHQARTSNLAFTPKDANQMRRQLFDYRGGDNNQSQQDIESNAEYIRQRQIYQQQKYNTQRLSRHKEEFVTDNYLKHSDFRGMIHSQYVDALNNCGGINLNPASTGGFSTDDKKFEQSLRMPATTKVSKRKSIGTVRGLFPLPSQTFSFSPESMEARKGISKRRSMVIDNVNTSSNIMMMRSTLSPSMLSSQFGSTKKHTCLRFSNILSATSSTGNYNQQDSIKNKTTKNKYKIEENQQKSGNEGVVGGGGLITDRNFQSRAGWSMKSVPFPASDNFYPAQMSAMKTLADFDLKSRRLGGIKGYSKSQYKEALTFVDKYVESLHLKNRKL